MSYRPKIKQDDGTTIDLPIDAETLNGKTASEYVDIASDQTITGMKAFSTSVWASISWIGLINADDAPAWQFNPAGLYFYPDRSQVLENKLIAYNSTSGLFVLGTNFNYTYSIPSNENSTAIATTEWVTAKINTALSSISDITNIVNNTTKIAETNFGGFSAGENSSATTGGGAVGSDASTLSGGAVGSGANSTTGGAVGLGAYTTTGFAGGYMAKASANGAVQLGTGTNNSQNTLQFRQYQLLDSEGVIPSDRLKNAALKKTWDDLAQYTYSGSGSLPNNILYPTMAFGDCEYREIIGADFNDIINNGHYVIRTNSTHVAAHAPINGSVSTATNGVWHLIVLRYTETYIRQIAIDVRNGTNAIQVRNYFNNSWGEWQSLLYTNNSVTRLMTYTTSSLSGSRTLSGTYYYYAFIIVRYYPSGADYWVEDIIPVDYLAEYPGTSSAHRVLTTQTTNGWCNYWFSSGTTFNWKAGDMYKIEVYGY